METSLSPEVHMFYGFGYCGFILLLALLFLKFPPKKINWFYGYRTKRSMANETIWHDANSFSMRMMVKLCLYSFLAPPILYFLYPSYNFLITVIVNTILILGIYFSTEKYLDQKYDDEGNQKT